VRLDRELVKTGGVLRPVRPVAVRPLLFKDLAGAQEILPGRLLRSGKAPFRSGTRIRRFRPAGTWEARSCAGLGSRMRIRRAAESRSFRRVSLDCRVRKQLCQWGAVGHQPALSLVSLRTLPQ
jgi:hypothetical protein